MISVTASPGDVKTHGPPLVGAAVIFIIPSTVTPAARPLLQSIKEHAVLLFGLLAIMWTVENGVRPRELTYRLPFPHHQ